MNVTAGIGVLGQASAMSQEMFPGRVTAAAAGEFHLGAKPSHLRALKVGQRPEFGYRKQLMCGRRVRRVPFRLSGRN